jgi:hypothetical protein
MKIFSSQVALRYRLASEVLHKNCKYKYEKHHFKRSVMNDQITRQKLQTSILLIVEMV